jgi:4,5-DOPA dioxygenase extradiol
MERKTFLTTMLAASGALALSKSLPDLVQQLPERDEKMPVFFIGHGSPMNAIEDNEFTQNWQKMAEKVAKPTAILVISAHWLTRGTFVTAAPQLETIHDFGGFPQALFDVQYPSPGNPKLAAEIADLFPEKNVGLDQSWGLDHGAWSVTRPMFPLADVPVLQMSIDFYQSGEYQYQLAKNLAALRKRGVLIIGSGNMVHNLRMATFGDFNRGGFDWAIELNETFKKLILDGNHAPLMNYRSLGKAAELAIPTPDHYFPLLYSLALQEKNEPIEIFNDKAIAGSLTMTSVKIW